MGHTTQYYAVALGLICLASFVAGLIVGRIRGKRSPAAERKLCVCGEPEFLHNGYDADAGWCTVKPGLCSVFRPAE